MPERFEVVRMLAGQLETTFASRRSACNVVTSFPVFFFFFGGKGHSLLRCQLSQAGVKVIFLSDHSMLFNWLKPTEGFTLIKNEKTPRWCK